MEIVGYKRVVISHFNPLFCDLLVFFDMQNNVSILCFWAIFLFDNKLWKSQMNKYLHN